MILRLLLTLILAFGFVSCAREGAVEETTAEATTTAGAAETAAARTPPCDWITEAEATEALGQPSKYRSATDDGSSNCIIDPVADGSGISVDFKVTDDVDAWNYESMNAPTISDLGDAAVWSSPTLAVKKGDRYLIAYFSRTGAPEGDLRTPAIAFAEKIVPKM
ncbi:MAG TPA: hypothetical protein VM557_04840 [Thermoanaerobaculia bacterium]|nr:hypothetical protein [Thermoanaerobaculia bacterium]